MDISLRITEPLKFSLRDDEDLVNFIQNLVKKQKAGESPILVVMGNNFLTNSMIFLAAELGYTGKFFQLTYPQFPEERPQHNKLEEKLQSVRDYQHITGRMIGKGTEYKDGGFNLAIQDPSGNRLTVKDVDILINATGKTQSTPLVDAMKEKGYIGTHPSFFGSGLHSNHEKLGGFHNFFTFNEIFTSPTYEISPESGHVRVVEPWGWEKAFEFGQAAQQPDDQSSHDIEN